MAPLKQIKIKSDSLDLYFKIPSEWNQVTRTMLKRIAQTLIENQESIQSQQLKLLYLLSGLKAKRFFDIVAPINDEAYESDLTVLDSLLKEVEFLSKVKFSKDLVGTIGIFPLCFKPIGNGLNNITLDQWIFAGSFAEFYYQTEDPKEKKKILNSLFATLYRPWFMPWRKWMLKPLKVVALLIPISLKQAVLLNFLGIKGDFLSRNPHLFNGGTKAKPNFEELITDLAGDKWGEVPKVGSKKARLVIVYLNKMIRDAEKASRNRR